MKILVSTHQGQLYNEELEYVVVKNQDGEFAIMNNHTPIVCVIKTGYIKLVRGEEILYVAVSNGILEFKDNVINVIGQEAHIGRDFESAKNHLDEVRKERLDENRRNTADFTKKEADMIDNLKKAKAGKL